MARSSAAVTSFAAVAFSVCETTPSATSLMAVRVWTATSPTAGMTASLPTSGWGSGRCRSASVVRPKALTSSVRLTSFRKATTAARTVFRIQSSCFRRSSLKAPPCRAWATFRSASLSARRLMSLTRKSTGAPPVSLTATRGPLWAPGGSAFATALSVLRNQSWKESAVRWASDALAFAWSAFHSAQWIWRASPPRRASTRACSASSAMSRAAVALRWAASEALRAAASRGASSASSSAVVRVRLCAPGLHDPSAWGSGMSPRPPPTTRPVRVWGPRSSTTVPAPCRHLA